MGNSKFQILGTKIPSMLGRTKIMQRLWNDLTKTTPSNLPIIGPRFVGKTVIMNALAQKAKNEGTPYSFVLYWHLGHVAPVSDDDFVKNICRLLKNELAISDGDYTEHQEYLNSHSFEFLKEVTDSLDSDNKPILMLWDGFDKPLGQGKLSGHLWDQMRTMFYGKKHKIVTATRKPLSELIRSQDAIVSPFWNIFDMTPVRVGPFDDSDREAILADLTGLSFNQGTKTELMNWSAGFPPLILEILNQIVAEIPSGPVNNENIKHAALKATERLSSLFSMLWDDCTSESKDLYYHLVERGDLLITDVGSEEQACLIEKGFAQKSGKNLTSSCRMLQHHIKGLVSDTGSMARLFDTWKDYKSNIRNLLERRLAQISRFDERLYRLVARAIQDIPDFPDDCLNNLTGIRDCALKLIWQREFGSAMCFPQDVITYWTAVPRENHNLVKQMMHDNCWDIPTDPLNQIRLLGLLTGCHRNFDARAKVTSKDTYVLIDAIHNFRNRAQHPDGQSIHVGVAVAAIMSCLELLACLDREL